MPGTNLPFIEKTKLFKAIFLVTIVPTMVILSVLLVSSIIHGDVGGIVLGSLFLLVLAGLLIVLLNHVLTVRIDESGIAFSYRPYFRKEKKYAWTEIAAAETVTYHPVRDFNGWGLKKSPTYGQGYTTIGDKGLAVSLTNGEKFLVTLVDTEAAREALARFRS